MSTDRPDHSAPAALGGAPLTRREARARERAAESARVTEQPSRPETVQPSESTLALVPVEVPLATVTPGPAAGAVETVLTRREARALEGGRVPAPLDDDRPRRRARAVDGRPAAAASRAARPGAFRSARSSSPRSGLARRTRSLGVVGGLLFVGATLVSTSVPANAYFVDTPENVAVKLAVAAGAGTSVGGTATVTGSQGYTASGTVVDGDVGRDGYSVSVVQGSADGAPAGDSDAAIRWPIAGGSPISSGFGARQVANCSFCSTYHQGLDFVPGAGTPIQAIADGTVSKVEQGGGALGYNVWIDHEIDGQTVTTVSAHMLAGSIKVAQGQKVKVGDQIGNVGSTGNSTGAHLHFEVHLSGLPVDPYTWLSAHAG